MIVSLAAVAWVGQQVHNLLLTYLIGKSQAYPGLWGPPELQTVAYVLTHLGHWPRRHYRSIDPKQGQLSGAGPAGIEDKEHG